MPLYAFVQGSDNFEIMIIIIIIIIRSKPGRFRGLHAKNYIGPNY